MIDPSVSLAMSVQSNPGAYAVLFGSGVSYTSGIPTGWGIVCDLVTRVARMHGEDVGDDPGGWYEARYGKEPDYSELLEAVARTPTERAQLLRSYFEPTETERARGLKSPTPAHRAMARLAKGGLIRTFITTNFDRLMEQALADENIVPTVIASCDDLAGAPPMSAGHVTVVKVHGDYVDCRIKNTPEELAAYEPPMNALLDRIIADHGFIMAGWSAMWDKALVDAFLRASPPRYGTWWAHRRPPKGPGAKLMAARRGEFVSLSGADEFFAELAARVLGGPDEKDAPEVVLAQDNLPTLLSSFVGREDHIDAINGLLNENRLVTLHALGGSGKTRTAIEVARSRLSGHADGATFVDLSAVGDAERVPEAIAYALGYGPEKLLAALRNRELLIVLDNCEHVVDAVRPFLQQLFSAAPRLSVLATSRVPLGLPGEVVFALDPMAVPNQERVTARDVADVESVRLFADRVREVNTRWRLVDEDAPHVARICRALDGHPLALELAAARVKLMSPEQIANRLDESLKLLRAGSRDSRPDRQKTLTAAWAWSLDALDEPAQLLFERLSVFRGGFTLEAVEAVCTDDDLVVEDDVLDLLTELIDQGLVMYAGNARYRVLEPVRQFGAGRIADRGQTEVFVRRHAGFFAELVSSAAREMNTDHAFIVLSKKSADVENMRHATVTIDDTADPVTALSFHVPFNLILQALSFEQEGDERLSRAMVAAPDAPSELLAAAQLILAYLRVGAENPRVANDALRAACQTWDAIGDPARRAECRYLAAVRALIDNELSEVERVAHEGLEIGGTGTYHASLLNTWLSWSLRQQDRFDEAAVAASAACELAGDDDPFRSAIALGAKAALEEDQGNWEVVERYFERQMELVNQHGVPPVVGRGAITEHNAVVQAVLGRTDKAIALARITHDIFSTRDNRGVRMYVPILHRGDRTPGDTERSLYRHAQRLKLPPLEAAADLLIERLEEFEGRLDRLGRPQKADDCRAAIQAVGRAVTGT